MSEDQMKGDVAKTTGKVESAAGGALGDVGMQAKGEARQVQGQAKAATGAAHDTISQAAETAHDVVSSVTDRAGQAYGRAAGAVSDVRGKVDPFVRDNPYAAVAVGAGVGLIVGVLLAGGGSRTIYVKSKG